MDDCGAGSFAFLLAHIPVLGGLHVWQHSLTEMKGSCQIRLDVSLPFSARVEVVHGLAVSPKRGADSAIVDQDVDSIVEEVGSFLGCFTDVVDAPEVAYRRRY